MNKIICFLFSHNWKLLLVSESKHKALMHLHPMAGCLAICSRCDKVWNDLPNDGRTDSIVRWSKPVMVI